MRLILFMVFTISVPAFSAETSYFSGEDVMKSPDGSIVYSSSPKLLKRQVDRGAGQILEEVILKSYQGGFEAKQLRLNISGTQFEVTDGSYVGKGEFYGLPWAWTGWVSEFNISGGARLKILDFLDQAGLKATAEYYDSSGKLLSVTFTDLKKIEASTYVALKEKLLGR